MVSIDSIQDVRRSDVERQCDYGVETEKHGAFEVVGLAILNNIGGDKHGDGEGNSLDCNDLAVMDEREAWKVAYRSQNGETCPGRRPSRQGRGKE